METGIIFIIVLIGIFQLILLVKIWQMTDDVRILKNKFILFSGRGFTDDRKTDLINETVYKRLNDWYKIRRGRDERKVSKNVISTINEDAKFIQNLIDEYGANEFYTIDLAKEAMVKAFVKK